MHAGEIVVSFFGVARMVLYPLADVIRKMVELIVRAAARA
jgi:hypothetical protein